MDKKIVGLIAAVSGLGTLGAAQASTPAADVERVMNPQSFAELLDPIPNAAACRSAAALGIGSSNSANDCGFMTRSTSAAGVLAWAAPSVPSPETAAIKPTIFLSMLLSSLGVSRYAAPVS